MALQGWLRNALLEEAGKLIARHELYAKRLAEERDRRQRRTTQTVSRLQVRRPGYWAYATGFDPYLVRSRCNAIAHSVRTQLLDLTYAPRNPSLYRVPKNPHETRPISVFQVADNTVSRLVYRSVLRKNRTLLSSRAYAYRDDIGISHALQFMQSEFARHPRLFVAEYDFRKYFDNIDHQHLWDTIDERGLLLTKLERSVLAGFLNAPEPTDSPYSARGGPPRRLGVPQGTSVSLILANIAAMPLDRALERLGVDFVRYADDTVIWSEDYGRICEAANLLKNQATQIGPAVNLEKSDGVRLFISRPEVEKSELIAKSTLAFVGHSIERRRISMGPKIVDTLRHRVSSLLRDNLLRNLQTGTQDLTQITLTSDRDYVVYVLQLRRYLYGDLSESEIRRYLRGGVPPRKYRGLMSFFPLVDDVVQLKALDQWIVSQTWLALRRRALMLQATTQIPLPAPHGLIPRDLARHRHVSSRGEPIDLRLPSLQQASALVRAASAKYGPAAVRGGMSLYEY